MNCLFFLSFFCQNYSRSFKNNFSCLFFSFAAKSLICCSFHHTWRQTTGTPSVYYGGRGRARDGAGNQSSHTLTEGEHPVSAKFRLSGGGCWELPTSMSNRYSHPSSKECVFSGANHVSAANQLRFSYVSATF